MRLLVAETAGFCWGVRRALDQAVDIASKNGGPLRTFGPLIHNSQVLEELEGQNIRTVESLEEVDSGPVLIRAHGVRPEVVEQLKARTPDVYDATCPLVRRVQKALSSYSAKGYDTVIVGDEDHAEVIGLKGYARGRCYVVADENEVERLPTLERVCVVAQTTQNDRTFERVVARLKERAVEVRAINTICEPTRDHQSETIELARMADLMVVVGGRHSANTVRLVKLVEREGTKALHVETDSELRPEHFAGCETVAVTAGASTPEWMINRVVARIHSFNPEARSAIRTLLTNLLSLVVGSNLYVAAGGAALTLTCLRLLDPAAVSRRGLPLIGVSAFYLLAMHAVNRYRERSHYSGWGVFSPSTYERFQTAMMFVGLGALAVVLALSAKVGPLPFVIVAISGLVGLLYSVKIVPLKWARHISGVRRIKDLPASRDFSTALGWTMVVAMLPSLVLGADWLLGAGVVAFAFVLVFLRSALLGVRDVQGDKIMGMETTLRVVGKRRTKVVLVGGIVGLTLLLLLLAFLVQDKILPLLLCLLVVYVAVVSWLYSQRHLAKGPAGELIVDGQFLLAGLVTLLCHWARA